MRLAVISDIHGNLLALEAVLAELPRHAPDATVNLGDCVTSPLWPRETLELLESLSVPTVRGNHDRWLATAARGALSAVETYTTDSLTNAQRAALGALPPTLRLDSGVLAVHGTPASDTTYLLEDKVNGRLCRSTQHQISERLGDERASLVLCGHSHTQSTAWAPSGTLVVNPGSVGCPRYAGDADPSAAESCSPHARYAVVTQAGARWSADLFVLAYDWDAAASRAGANGFDEWAAGFLRGA